MNDKIEDKLSDYADEAVSHPMKTAIKVIIALFILGIIAGGLAWGLGWFSNAGQVAQEQFSPKVLLQKYEWFKDASAQLDNKQATIKVLESRITNLEKSYGNTSRQDWARSDKEQYNVWQNEIAGVKASYNSLAAEYNSQMAKFNWRFTNVGNLPAGATEPLPREYKPYIED